jgi:hypothetical protein
MRQPAVGREGNGARGYRHEQAPDAVDDAGNSRQQLDGYADRTAQPLRAQLAQEQRDQHAHRHGDQHGDQRRDKRAVDRRQCPETLRHRVPVLIDQKRRTEGPQGRQTAERQGNDDTPEQRQHAEGRGARHLVE